MASRTCLTRQARQMGAWLGLTLSAGANCLGSFLRDETLHAYVRGSWERLTQAVDLEPVARGANVVLLPVGEEGLLYLLRPVRERLGLPESEPLAPVAPVQLYLDLCAAGGRWAEQAPRLREEVLGYD